MRFQLFRRPGVIALVDDDGNYLSTLGMLAPPEWGVELFTSPKSALKFVLNDAPILEEDLGRIKAIAQSQTAESADPVAERMLAYWRDNPQRFDRVCVVVSDFAMPAMTGLDLFRAMGSWAGGRILLTGFADETVAVKAFNEKLIDHFVPKNSKGTLMDDIERTVRRYCRLAHPRTQSIFREALDDKRFAALQVEDVASELRAIVDAQWPEYVVLDRPFGVLGLSFDGKPGWLQLETAASLSEAADVAADMGVAAPQVEEIRKGTILAAPELGLRTTSLTSPAKVLGTSQPLYAAVFEVDESLAACSYSHWLNQRAERAIRD